MPGRGKGKARGKSRGRKIGERLEWRITYKISKRLLKNSTAQEVRDRAVDYYAENGEEMPGVQMIAQWRNPNNRKPQHRAWKYTTDSDQSLDAFFETIGPALVKAQRSRHRPDKILPGGRRVKQ